MFRRFDVVVELQKPDERQLAQLMLLRLSSFGLTQKMADVLAKNAAGWSFADASRACDDAVRSMALDGREKLAETDVLEALKELRSREPAATR
jgi:ATP-dependent 26S proteasome regulatory subunit